MVEISALINSVIHHIGIGVQNSQDAEQFYDSLLVDYLGMEKEIVQEASAGWKGRGTRVYLYRSNVDANAQNLQHLAFTARNRQEVETFPGWAKLKGIEVLSEPKEYPEYGGDYFAVFFQGPDKLKLELVHLSEVDGAIAL
ncbi:MAG: VOC family protein [Gammaproteobacteria bacterium]